MSRRATVGARGGWRSLVVAAGVVVIGAGLTAAVQAQDAELDALEQRLRELESAARERADAEQRAQAAAAAVAQRRAQEAAAARARQEQYANRARPEMVNIPGGRFRMGCSVGDSSCSTLETPAHDVTVRAFRLARHEVTVGQFRSFTEATGYQTEAERNIAEGCYSFDSSTSGWAPTAGRTWRNPGFEQTDDHPVVCVSWNDARAFAEWLSEITSTRYRLPTEAEFEYASRAGTTTIYPWGNAAADACTYANVADETARDGRTWTSQMPCSDGFFFTAPVGSYRPNGFGIYDLTGNVWEWVQDCWNDSYVGAPTDGSAWMSGDCSQHPGRGGSWTPNDGKHSADRGRGHYGHRHDADGFRLAQDVP